MGFLETGEVARVEVELGTAGALAELALCLVFDEEWPPAREPAGPLPEIAVH